MITNPRITTDQAMETMRSAAKAAGPTLQEFVESMKRLHAVASTSQEFADAVNSLRMKEQS